MATAGQPKDHSLTVSDGLWKWAQAHFERKNPASRLRDVLEQYAREMSRTGDPQLDMQIRDAAPPPPPPELAEGAEPVTAYDGGVVMPAMRDTSCDQCGIYIRQGTLIHYWRGVAGRTHARCAVHKEREDLG